MLVFGLSCLCLRTVGGWLFVLLVACRLLVVIVLCWVCLCFCFVVLMILCRLELLFAGLIVWFGVACSFVCDLCILVLLLR